VGVGLRWGWQAGPAQVSVSFAIVEFSLGWGMKLSVNPIRCRSVFASVWRPVVEVMEGAQPKTLLLFFALCLIKFLKNRVCLPRLINKFS